MAGAAMRGAIERRYGIRLVFQNCHRVAVFRPEAAQARADFITARTVTDPQPAPGTGQLLTGRRTHSRPALLDHDEVQCFSFTHEDCGCRLVVQRACHRTGESGATCLCSCGIPMIVVAP